MNWLTRSLILAHAFFMTQLSSVWAADTPEDVANDFSKKVIDILRGPIAKVLGIVILLIGVASLIRGRHKVAISCAVAFGALVFLPILLKYIGIE